MKMGDSKEKGKGREGQNGDALSLVSGCHSAPVARKGGNSDRKIYAKNHSTHTISHQNLLSLWALFSPFFSYV